MRKLSKRQKKELDKMWDEFKPTSVHEIPIDRWNALIKMNDFETIWQCTDRYLWDKHWERE